MFRGFRSSGCAGPANDQNNNNKNKGQPRTRQQNVKQGEGLGPDLKDDLIELHESLLARFAPCNKKRGPSTLN
jgi:hypothetical protein